MLKIRLENNVSYKIDNFAKSYFNVALDLLTDCGIETVQIIKGNYIRESLKLKDEIYSSLYEAFSSEQIIAVKILPNGEFSTVFRVRNWNLFVKYSEDTKKKIRFIEDIKFNKR